MNEHLYTLPFSENSNCLVEMSCSFLRKIHPAFQFQKQKITHSLFCHQRDRAQTPSKYWKRLNDRRCILPFTFGKGFSLLARALSAFLHPFQATVRLHGPRQSRSGSQLSHWMFVDGRYYLCALLSLLESSQLHLPTGDS